MTLNLCHSALHQRYEPTCDHICRNCADSCMRLSTRRLQQLPQASAKDKTACCMHNCVWTGQNSSRTIETKHGPHSVRSSAYSIRHESVLPVDHLRLVTQYSKSSETACLEQLASGPTVSRCSSLHWHAAEARVGNGPLVSDMSQLGQLSSNTVQHWCVTLSGMNKQCGWLQN